MKVSLESETVYKKSNGEEVVVQDEHPHEIEIPMPHVPPKFLVASSFILHLEHVNEIRYCSNDEVIKVCFTNGKDSILSCSKQRWETIQQQIAGNKGEYNA